jgi:hypothetical protein
MKCVRTFIFLSLFGQKPKDLFRLNLGRTYQRIVAHMLVQSNLAQLAAADKI